MGAKHGLGKKETLLSSDQDQAVIKAEYAADLLYVLTLGLSKISILLLQRRLCVDKKLQRAALGVCCVVAAWIVVGIVALAARCGHDLPWTATNVVQQCINLRTFWIAMLPVDILTELAIIIIPVLMMYPVQIASSKKTVILVAFAFRFALIAASIVRIFYLVDYIPSHNFTFRTINTEILNQVVVSVSITTACIPCLKPFLDVTESGQMAINLRNKTHNNAGSSQNSYAMGSLAYANGRPPTQKKGTRSNKDLPHRADSVSSTAESDKMIINKKMEYVVRYESTGAEGTSIHKGDDNANSIGWARPNDS